jgi:hypothetical protein
MASTNTTHCRFYENKFPAIDEFVVVNVKQGSLLHLHPFSYQAL